MNDKKPHLSPSQIDMFTRCPEAWRRRYKEGDKIPPAIAMLKGTGMHGGAETNFAQKIESFEDLPVADIIDASVAAFEGSMSDGYELSQDEQVRGATVILAEAKEEVVELAKAHAETQAGEYQPVLVEKRMRVELPDSSHDLLGIVDLVGQHSGDHGAGKPILVTDFKTAGRKKSQADADESVQLTYYAAAAHLKLQVPADEVRLDVLVKSKNGPTRQLLRSTRGSDDYDALSHRVNAVVAAINAGVFHPAVPGTWWCSPRFCGYWSTCRFVNSERIAKAAE